jgi:hypothetical protein
MSKNSAALIFCFCDYGGACVDDIACDDGNCDEGICDEVATRGGGGTCDDLDVVFF